MAAPASCGEWEWTRAQLLTWGSHGELISPLGCSSWVMVAAGQVVWDLECWDCFLLSVVGSGAVASVRHLSALLWRLRWLPKLEVAGPFPPAPGQPRPLSRRVLLQVTHVPPLCVCLPVCVSGEQGSQGHPDTSPQKCCGRTHMGSLWTCGPVVSPSKGLLVAQGAMMPGPSLLSTPPLGS